MKNTFYIKYFSFYFALIKEETMKASVISGKKIKRERDDDDSNSLSEKPQSITETPKPPAPSALRLILKFEGPSTNGNDSSSAHASTVNNSNVEQSDKNMLSTPKKSKKKKKDRDQKKNIKNSSHPESMYIVLDSSETQSNTKEPPTKAETPAERERRLCVPLLRQKHNRTPLQRLLDYAIQQLEDKDIMQVFAWPVTDQIAPGYSKVVKTPMDFSTIRQKIEENMYANLSSFTGDFQLMCNNAMLYNRPDTMYYKAAKRLLHSGLKFLSVEKLRQLANSFPLIKQIPPEQLGFDWETGSPVEVHINNIETTVETDSKDPFRKRNHGELTPEQALELAKKSACSYDERQFLKRRKTTFSMGFLRQRQDGSTSLAVLVPGEGVDPERPGERVVTLGQLVGKLNQGTGQLQGFREHRRNIAKAVKPLSYGPFGSYAPSYDSTFANLSKEESDLVYGTYGEENPSYIENVLGLAKVCDYTLVMVDNLLDLMSGGEYRKSKNVIDEQKKFQEEEERVRELIENRNSGTSSNAQNVPEASSVKIEIEQLKTLADLGIDTSFLKEFESINNNGNPTQEKLDLTSQLLEKLHQVQYERLSAPPPSHLSQISHPSDLELQLAEKVVENLAGIIKDVPPASVTPVPAIRKAMGVVSDTVNGSSGNSAPSNSGLEGIAPLPGEVIVNNSNGVTELDSDLRDILENGSSSCTFQIQGNKTIDEMLSDT